jgi:tRNA1(Val) A37 N6-methylase TrmN6
MQYTVDSIWRKEIRIKQPVKGYRFGLDAVLLAHFVKTEAADRLLEIGAGSGVVTILVSAFHRFASVATIEIQGELAELCRENFKLNNIDNSEVFQADAKNLGTLFGEASFDLIYSNPPYRKTGSGKLNPSKQKATARHELHLKLQDLFECSLKYLRSSGRLTLILPAFRESDFNQLTDRHNFYRHEWRYVHSFADAPPAFFLATVGKSSSRLTEHRPLVIYEKPGQYTLEMQSLLSYSNRDRNLDSSSKP